MRAAAALILCLPAIVGCGPPPGKGPKAEAGYERARPVIAALERYHAEQHGYPGALGDLMPRYLQAVPPDLTYGVTPQSYRIEFTHTGPGMNHCAYTPEAKWSCDGYY